MASKPLASLPFLCVWAKKKPGDNAEHYLTACKQFFQDHKGTATVTFGHPVPLLTGDCADTLWQLQCELNFASPLEVPQIESLSADIARQWCTSNVQDSALSGFRLWLMPDRKLGFRQDFLALQQEVELHSVSFGTFVGLNLFAERHAIVAKTTSAGYNLDCTFKHDERHLQVFLGLSHCVMTRELYRLSVDYDSIVRVVVHDPVGGPMDAFLHLRTLPLFYRAIDNVYFFASYPEDQRHKTRDEMDFQRTLKVGCSSCSSVLESRDVGGCWVLKLSFANSEQAHLAISRMSRRCEAAQFVYAHVRTTLVEESSIETLRQRVRSRLVPQMQFRCSYALDALLENSDDALVQMGLMSSEVQDVALRQLESLAQRSGDALEQAMFTVGRALDRRAVVTLTTALPLAVQRMLREMALPRAIPHNSCLIRRLVVTPSRVFYLPPAVHSENRVLRKFDASCALRVSFRDDNFAPLSDALRVHHEKQKLVEQVVGRFLRAGIWIGERHFRLLAGSEAGIRNHEMWLYANDPKGKTVDTVRPWMGDLDGQPSLTGMVALMAHCLTNSQQSTTVPLHDTTTTEQPTSVTLSEKVLEKVADIEGGTRPDTGKPFVFSEGIGMISPSLMREVCTDLDMVSMPSAIQICYAGYAGVVCVNDTLVGDKLVVRKSMYKFNCSTSESIEVVRVSAPTPVFLNRPLITILEQLGVPRQVFLHLQQKMVLQLCDAFVDDLTALRVLCTYSNASLPFFKLHVHGMSLSREPFTRSLLLAVYKSLIAGLQEESRVAVPPDGGRSMMGVLDETGTLEYGQVFVQYTQLGVNHNWIASDGAEDEPVTEVLTGTVLVTKEGCFYPEDVRKFEAVDVPALHHIKDCIVFPSKGPRPHPNEIGGSGLGGDEYIVIWEENLLFPGDNREPRAPRRASRKPPSTGVLNEDMIQFLCDNIVNDNVGIMSDSYLVFAGALQAGIFHRRCLSLADKISISLDSAKTGVFAEPARREVPKQYPDWLCGKYGLQPTCLSMRALGQLHRANRPIPCRGVTLAFKTEDFHCGLFEYPGWAHHVESAREAMSVYAWNVSQILHQHGIESEAEVITGVVSSVSRYEHGRNKAGTLAVAQYRALAELMQARFFANVDVTASRQGGQTGRVLLEMASAWYMVTYMDTLKGAKNVLGFPWCIADNLLLLLRERSGGFPVPRLSSPPNVLATMINSRGTKGLAEDKALDMLLAWARREGLLRDASEKPRLICESCLKWAFSEFAATRQAGQEPTIGGPWDDPCRAVTTGEYVCGFLRQLTVAPLQLPACGGCKCGARQSRLPMLAALLRYPRLAMSRDVGCFDLPCDPSLCDGAQELCESQPLRIDVTNRDFLSIVVERPDIVRDLLCQWSAVKDVIIRVHRYRTSKYYVVMSAVGHPWALCYFDEIVLQCSFQETIVTRRPP